MNTETPNIVSKTISGANFLPAFTCTNYTDVCAQVFAMQIIIHWKNHTILIILISQHNTIVACETWLKLWEEWHNVVIHNYWSNVSVGKWAHFQVQMENKTACGVGRIAFRMYRHSPFQKRGGRNLKGCYFSMHARSSSSQQTLSCCSGAGCDDSSVLQWCLLLHWCLQPEVPFWESAEVRVF